MGKVPAIEQHGVPRMSERRDELLKKELNSEIWGKGACDVWEKWVCLGGRNPNAWSMMPHGVLQNVCSHFWQRSAFVCGWMLSDHMASKREK